MAFVGNQWAVGLDWFSPHRSAERTGGAAFGLDGSADSGSTNFFIPEFGLNYMLRPDLALGLTVYGNGGMNTDYPGGQLPSPSGCGPATGPGTGFNPAPGPYNLLCGTGNLGVDLSQLIIAPTLAWKFHERHSIGIAPLFAYQRFKAEGLQAFQGLSTSPGNVTNNGYDSSTGWGVRVGYYGNLTEQIQVGASYSSKIGMDNFDKYQGLFAQSGGFDIPSNWSLGVAFKPTPAWLLALDYERINYSDVDSVHNRSNLILQCPPPPASPTSNCLGGSNGAGFGWQSVNVWRLGVQYQVNPPMDGARGLQPQRQPDPAAGRDVQHPRPRRHQGPCDARRDLDVGQAERDHRRVHVRVPEQRHGREPVQQLLPAGMQRTCRRRSRCTSGRSACSTHGGSDAAAYSPRLPSARSFASQRSRLAALASTVPIRVSLIGPMPTKPRMFRSRLLRLCARKNQR